MQVFYYAVKAVVHPTAALFDAMTQTLKPLCVNALRRIFMMCDVDKVGLISSCHFPLMQLAWPPRSPNRGLAAVPAAVRALRHDPPVPVVIT